jgi:hypothetical protein
MTSSGHDVCGNGLGLGSTVLRLHSFPENFDRRNLFRPPKSRDFSTLQSRLASFERHQWPTSTPQRPQQLAEAGFFYEGQNFTIFACRGRIFYEGHIFLIFSPTFQECWSIN